MSTLTPCPIRQSLPRLTPAQCNALHLLWSGKASIVSPYTLRICRVYHRDGRIGRVTLRTMLGLEDAGYVRRYSPDRELSKRWELTPEGEAYSALFFD